MEGRCLDGNPHQWLVGEPEYDWIGGVLMEWTHWVCMECGVGRDNLCPMAPEVWSGEEWGNPPTLKPFREGRG